MFGQDSLCLVKAVYVWARQCVFGKAVYVWMRQFTLLVDRVSILVLETAFTKSLSGLAWRLKLLAVGEKHV